ncbi:MFS general substrate transporter [Thelephora terrestris]|uniref:MFS general substrate transporter n=1 Tax=Thelephora terrestris TaxID=56493 RepID=A0A9P6HFN7_9AGAM|nr:MFS general substrate transporter [Thelephora terrestris]
MTVSHNPHADVSGIDEGRLLRKVDWKLLPWLSFLYFLSFLDRTSIGNAKLYNLTNDLRLSDQQYLLCLTVFYFSYSIFEVPSNVILKMLHPRSWIALLVISCGIIMVAQGLVRNYGELLSVTWLLGLFQAGIFPGVTYYLSCWYKRSEFGIRAAIFFSAASVSGAFGAFLAAAISKMNGILGKAGWEWIFILEGLVTIIAGVMSYWIIQDFPDGAKFLTEAELLMYAGTNGPLYAFALFLPTIINQIGYQANLANLLTIPIYVLVSIVTCSVGFYADRKGQRGRVNIICLCIAATGYIILIFSRIPALSYFAVYLAACGIFPTVPNTIAWVSNNVEGSSKRSVSIAMVISFGSLNGAVSSNVYRARDGPWYTLGHGIVLIYICLCLLTSLVYHLILKTENARRDRGLRDEIIDGENDKGDTETIERLTKLNGRFPSVEDAKREKGDGWSGYRYIL